ncbi:MAG: MarR family transcriptional regulator [Myxococcota bacterium]
MSNDLGLLLLRAQRDFEQRLVEGLTTREHGLTPAQVAVVLHLGPDGTRLGSIAAKVGTTKQAVGQVVDQLEALSYVERAPDPADARARLVRPTKKGQALIAEARAVSAGIRRDWKKRLGADRLTALEDALTALENGES